ncbi:DNA-binding response regulator [Streptomyces syringium]|uniref:DNA-binding response regulator n=1 Tax=Streptomyces syringium TaxID=76729 RepID=UPI00364AF922
MLYEKRITVNVHAGDELTRARLARRLRPLPGVDVVREGGEVDILFLGRDEQSAGDELHRLTRDGRAPVVVVAEELGETELMAIAEYGVASVLWGERLTAGRLSRAVHNAAGCCPRLPVLTALV